MEKHRLVSERYFERVKNMELVDRYLKSVGTYLPKEQKDDILRELSENIRSKIEDQEKELGRSLTEAEQEALVKRHGNPLLVAGRYRQEQRSVAFGPQWIGPELFPFYVKVLSFNLGLASLVILTIFTALFASGQQVTVGDLIGALFMQVLIQGGTITTIFAVANTQLTKFPDRWNPRKPGQLPALTADEKTAGREQRVSRVESISQFIALGFSAVWLRAVQRSSHFVFASAAGVLTASPVWRQIYWPLILVALVGMLQSVINLFYPRWVRFHAWTRMGMNAGSLAIVYFLLRARVWVTLNVSDPTAAGNSHQHSIAIINQSIFYSLLIAVLILVGFLVVDVRRLLRDRRMKHPATI
jgi:hypothetical protein